MSGLRLYDEAAVDIAFVTVVCALHVATGPCVNVPLTRALLDRLSKQQ